MILPAESRAHSRRVQARAQILERLGRLPGLARAGWLLGAPSSTLEGQDSSPPCLEPDPVGFQGNAPPPRRRLLPLCRKVPCPAHPAC